MCGNESDTKLCLIPNSIASYIRSREHTNRLSNNIPFSVHIYIYMIVECVVVSFFLQELHDHVRCQSVGTVVKQSPDSLHLLMASALYIQMPVQSPHLGGLVAMQPRRIA